VGDWIATRKDLEHVNSSWMIPPVGNLLAALVGPALDAAYIPAMQFWFAFAIVLWMLLFAITFTKAVLHTESGARPGLPLR
jgi:tellurite resistance protein TehA-like permease